jgi:hypothetical protein
MTREAIGDPDEADQGDFADEHADTTVDRDITGDRDDTEPETPRGWDGLSSDGPP